MQFFKFSFLLAALTCTSVQAGIIVDFTSADWSDAQGQTSFSVGDITLTSSLGNLTFNANDNAPGCGNANQGNLISETGLACIGDGIGIGDDEITQQTPNRIEQLTLSFSGGPVNILGIDLLDLFANEQTGEIAVINGLESQATGDYNFGGYWETGFSFYDAESLVFTGMSDSFSDYSLARIEYEYASVPEPGVIALLGAGLMGLGLARRKARKS